MMPELEILASTGLGSLLGIRHAFEPDHLAAVSTLVTGERSSARAAWLGVWWGLGHTLTVIATGGLLVILHVEMPALASEFFDLCVMLLLVGFGMRAIGQATRRESAGANGPGIHSGGMDPRRVNGWTFARRPLLVGAAHGLAGTGALTAVVVAALPSTTAQIAWMALFGFGSTVAMCLLSALLGWPIARLGSRRGFTRAMSFAVGCISTGLGLLWGYPLVVRLL